MDRYLVVGMIGFHIRGESGQGMASKFALQLRNFLLI